MFRESAIEGDSTILEEYMSSVANHICIDESALSKTITTQSNQELELTVEVRELLKS